MVVAQDFLHHPRRLFLRRALFQVHLWVGVLLSIYIACIAISGSILVFEDELTAYALPKEIHPFTPGSEVSPGEITQRFHAAYPDARLSQVTLPFATVPAFRLEAADANGHEFHVVADPVTGDLHHMPRTWLDVVHDFHVYLLLPTRYGAQVNAVGAAALMVLTLSGLLLWWPGIKTWTRGLRVNLRANWRRVNYDLHNAIGFWTLLIVFWWALSGFYFGFYPFVFKAVNAVLPIRNMRVPAALPASNLAVHLPLERILSIAQSTCRGGRLYGFSDPLVTGPSVYAYLDLREPGDFAHRDIVQVDSGTGRVLSVWHYAEKHSLGDWILWSMHPLHFGTLWGSAIKAVWAVLGFGLALLSITGLIMYWNRDLRHRWRALR